MIDFSCSLRSSSARSIARSKTCRDLDQAIGQTYPETACRQTAIHRDLPVIAVGPGLPAWLRIQRWPRCNTRSALGLARLDIVFSDSQRDCRINLPTKHIEPDMATSRLNNNLQVPQKHLATFSLENPSSRQALSAFAVLNANGDLISAIGYLDLTSIRSAGELH